MQEKIYIKDILKVLEHYLPPALQESYDNCGIQVGLADRPASGVLLAVDITEAVVDEAVEKGCNLIIAHHPLLFKPLKQLTAANYIERCIIKAVKHDIVIYAAHTNADNAGRGLNDMLARKFGLKKTRPLEPMKGQLVKLVCYVPESHAESVRHALWEAGAGEIGAYDQCSYNLTGNGTYRAGAGTQPFIGKQGVLHTEPENLIMVILPRYLCSRVIAAMLAVHPYEEPAYDLVSLDNEWATAGAGIVGDLEEEIPVELFLQKTKEVFGISCLCHSCCAVDRVKRVAICGGAGAFLWRRARREKADVLITGEAKYNDFFDVEGRPMLVTVGHYESEQIAAELFSGIISEKFPNFEVYLSQICANPVHHF
ncbi:Nif3-like dinuclear metal center hexameric protein [Porphyromonas macacae]|uniref:Nif3-like dinuclear metal center hexameric protein n=1 Tax=Porphyromonas macacae TaxID=28115 RepID=UPI0009DE8B77|nr:Nif3-like dinuclear metal center hexameric protein [Porphyromonas macacae]